MADIIRYYYTVQKPMSLRGAAADARRAAEQPQRVRSRPPRRPRAPDTDVNGDAVDDATPVAGAAALPHADSGGWFRDAIAVAVGRKMRAAAAGNSSAPVELISDESEL